MNHVQMIRRYNAAAQQIGFRVDSYTVGRHLRLRLSHADGRTALVTAACSPSDWRNLRNFVSNVRHSANTHQEAPAW